jgi:hypothetical protein
MQNFDHNIGFWEKRQFFRRKLSKIAENCDHNIDSWGDAGPSAVHKSRTRIRHISLQKKTLHNRTLLLLDLNPRLGFLGAPLGSFRRPATLDDGLCHSRGRLLGSPSGLLDPWFPGSSAYPRLLLRLPGVDLVKPFQPKFTKTLLFTIRLVNTTLRMYVAS